LIPDGFSAIPSVAGAEPELEFVEGFDQLDAIGVVVPERVRFQPRLG
jgi:leucyl aminopeptidase